LIGVKENSNKQNSIYQNLLTKRSKESQHLSKSRSTSK